MKNFFDKFQNLKGCTFISINNYLSKTSGEVANHLINVGISVHNAKESDLQKLLNCTDNDLQTLSEQSVNIGFMTFKTALLELIESAKKNLSENVSDRSNQSQAQTDAYINILPGIRMHKETMQFFIFGQTVQKTVIIKGQYKQVNSSPKTLAKNAIKKHLDLRSDKFREYCLGNIDNVKMQGETLEISI